MKVLILFVCGWCILFVLCWPYSIAGRGSFDRSLWLLFSCHCDPLALP